MGLKTNLLFSPIQIGSLTLQNRIVLLAHLTNYADGFMPSERHVHYYRERARGGAGLIITEDQSVHPSDHPYEFMIHAYNPDVIPVYRKMTEAVHNEGAKMLAQINHSGSQGTGMYTRHPIWAPSSVADPMFREMPKAMEIEDIESVIQGYAHVARHTQLGGFDGIELQCSHSSLIRQFLSKHTNHRKDQYGGGLENRIRFLREIIAAIREAVGRRYVVGVRLCGDELLPEGIILNEAIATARLLEIDGLIDFINTSIGTATHTLYMIEGSMHVPPGYALYIPSSIRKAVNLPVIGGGRIKDPLQAERILNEGHVDLVGIVRAQISDPQFALKSRQGRVQDIRLCLSCNQECVGRVGLNRWMGCIQTPGTGQERIYGIDTLVPAKQPKRVIVVGSGPAGMRAAVVAARRGHHVTLYEMKDRLGGQVNLAIKVANRAEFGDLVRNLLHELNQVSVEVKKGVKVTPELIADETPEAVIVATGSIPNRAPFPGADAPEVVDISDVLAEQTAFQSGQRVLIVDQLAFYEATSVGEFLAGVGCQVEIITPTLYVGQDLGISLDLEHWYRRAAQMGIICIPDMTPLSIEDGALHAIHNYSGETKTYSGYDKIVLAVPRVANSDLYFAIKGLVSETYRVGDCVSPRKAHMAILEGERVARIL